MSSVSSFALKELRAQSDPTKAASSSRFFKTGQGEYGEGDIFLGISIPDLRSMAKKHQACSLEQIENLLESEYHEARMLALILLTMQYEKADEKGKKAIVDVYLSHTNRINNWDLVDVSAYKILGDYVRDRDRAVLDRLATSGHLWSERIAMVSTFAFIRAGETKDTFRFAKIFLTHSHDLMHKATGWMLREAGKRDVQALRLFLDTNASHMPRTMLRYAIEKMSAHERRRYLRL